MDIIQVITRELNVEKWQVEAAVKLIDEGCTIPFISRYRKEATGTLNDEQLRNLNERLTYLRNLEDKKAQVLGSIEEQGKLTPELKKQIEAAQTLVVVEDLYRPYRPKRRTRAIIAREKGLGSLADIILLQMTKKPLEEEAKAFLRKKKSKLWKRPSVVPEISLRSTFPMKQIIVSASVREQWIRELYALMREMRRSSLYTRCIMTLKSR